MLNSLKRPFSTVIGVSVVWFMSLTFSPGALAGDQPVRIIAFGAHPDDCDQGAGGSRSSMLHSDTK
jgi:hypothetical protein